MLLQTCHVVHARKWAVGERVERYVCTGTKAFRTLHVFLETTNALYYFILHKITFPLKVNQIRDEARVCICSKLFLELAQRLDFIQKRL